MKKLLLVLMLFPVIGQAQFLRRFNFSGVPTPPCQDNYVAVNISTLMPYICVGGTYRRIPGTLNDTRNVDADSGNQVIVNSTTYTQTVNAGSKIITGYEGDLVVDGAGNLGGIADLTSYLFYSGSGSVTAVYGVDSEPNGNGGTITNLAAYFASPTRTAGTVTNMYGLWVNNITGGSSNWAIKTGTGLVEFGDNTKAPSYSTTTNCADSAGAAACGSAASGAFVVDASSTSTVVSTTAVTANSRIFVQEDSSLGTALSVTCNTQSSLTLGAGRVTARTASTSFTFTLEVGPTSTPACFSYFIIN